MRKLKNAIIRWLGGNTNEEVAHAFAETVEQTYLALLDHLIDYADAMNGLPGDEWSKKMYEHLQKLSKIETTSEVCDSHISITTKTTNNNGN